VLDVLDALKAWRAAGDPFVLATVVGTSGGAPRELGAAMAVRMVDGVPADVVGSVSGGCVEAAVYESAAGILASGRARLDVYGTGDADAVGLTCGGTLSVLIAPSTLGTDWLDRVDAASAVATVLAGPEELVGRSVVVDLGPESEAGHAPHTLLPGHDELSCAVARDAEAMIGAGTSGRRGYRLEDGCPVPEPGAGTTPGLTVFISVFTPPPHLIILGALDHAASLATVGRFLGYRVTVCDARAVFATPERFPDAHEVVVDWPHRYLASVPLDASTAVCVLTHDPKFDVPALDLALRSPAGYVGAMGSRRTCDDRVARLRAAGLAEPELARLAAPIGLDLGAATPAETAVSIAAELIAVRRRRSGGPLKRSTGPIHHP
jgi:xanthine dehydrogenase accessory factor